MSLEIIHEKDSSRFVARDNGEEAGFLGYRDDGNEIVIEHTIVDPEHRGKGLAGRLTETALTELGTASGVRIVPECSYVADYVRSHPEHLPLTTR